MKEFVNSFANHLFVSAGHDMHEKCTEWRKLWQKNY